MVVVDDEPKHVNIILSKTPDVKMRSVVQRNLYSHRERNHSAAIMFSLSIAFVIFSGSMVRQQSDQIVTLVKMVSGADVTATSLSNQILDEATLRTELNRLAELSIVDDYTFLSFRLKVVRVLPKK